MKNIFYILLLLSCNIFSQPKFFVRQNDHTIHFGANLQGLTAADEIRMIRDSLGWDYIRDAVTLSAYTTGIDNGLQQRYDAGMHVIYNINWGAGTQPRDFPTGAALTTYANRLTTFLTFNWQFLVDGWVVIENEPYNGVFYNYTDHQPVMKVTDYINLLNVAIPIVHSFNLKVSDGATHLNYYDDIINPPVTGAAAKRGDSALTYYATMNLDLINYHFDSPSNMGTDAEMTPDIIKDYTAYGTGRTGINYLTNEWHQEPEGTSADWDSFAASVVNRTRQAHIPIAIVFGADGLGNGLPLVDNATLKLTSLGRAYRDAVTPPN